MYLLLCLVAGARPLGDDVLLGLGVGCESESDAREGGALCDGDVRSAPAPHVAAWDMHG
jgi:hypothetical protein